MGEGMKRAFAAAKATRKPVGIRHGTAKEAALDTPTPASDKGLVDIAKRREWLLLSSYCGTDNEDCNNRRPCADCLAMNNVFDNEGKYLRQLGAK